VTTAPGPWRVVLADIEALPSTVDSHRAAGGRYERALLFLTRDGVLVGEAEVDVDTPLDPTALVAGLGGAPRTVPVARDDLPFASVVVPTTMARRDELDRCLAGLLALDYPAYEIVLVDNRPSTPGRAALYERLTTDPRVRVVAEPRPGISAARNRGVSVSRGEFVAFTDDDAVADPRWLRAIGARFVAEPDTDCVTGPVLPAELETPVQLWFERSGSKLPTRYVRTTFRGPARTRGLRRGAFEVQVRADGQPDRREFVYRAGTFGMGANLALRATSLAELGGFHEALGTGTATRGGEDIEVLARLLRRGRQLTYDPAVFVWHWHRHDLASARQQLHGYGRGLTAALTAMVVADPRHVVGLGHLATTAARVLRQRSDQRRDDGYPRELAARERRGLALGPASYGWERLRRLGSRRSG
jgi:glycosyltransferase involved in cell wall biosynthesis